MGGFLPPHEDPERIGGKFQQGEHETHNDDDDEGMKLLPMVAKADAVKSAESDSGNKQDDDKAEKKPPPQDEKVREGFISV